MPYVSHTPEDIQAMLKVIGTSNVDDLFSDLPENVFMKEALDLPDGLCEEEVLRFFRKTAGQNRGQDQLTSFLGGGVYDSAIPAAVDAIISRSEFLTAYTPYQPEVSQGTLQAIYEWQTFICRLTGLDVANASMYDGATALGEAVLVALAAQRKSTVVLPAALNPRYRRVVATMMRGMGIKVLTAEAAGDGTTDPDSLAKVMTEDVGCVVIQNPNYLGLVEPVDSLAGIARDGKATVVAAVNPVSLSVLKAPAEYGAEIAVGEAQPFGIPCCWGGPLLGFMACSEKLKRRIPGRVVGATTDNRGQSGYVLTLQTREQHIRREKATSNICSNQGLNAMRATVYMAMLGAEGLRELGEANLTRINALRDAVSGVEGVELPYPGPVFNETVLRLGKPAREFVAFARENGVLAGINLEGFAVGNENDLLVAVTEKRTAEEIQNLAQLLARFHGQTEVK
jgi:glycine cleavage system P protein (glycine dehydrogenase) subunit 1